MAAKAFRLAPLLLLAAVFAATAAVPTVADLDAMQGETLMIRAQAAKAKAAQELSDASTKTDSPAGGTAAKTDAQLPTARGLFGANGSRYVVFLYANGGVAEGKVGDALPGGFRVLAFDSGGVDLRADNGRKHRIPFSMQAPTPPPAPAAPVQQIPSFLPTPVPPVTR